MPPRTQYSSARSGVRGAGWLAAATAMAALSACGGDGDGGGGGDGGNQDGGLPDLVVDEHRTIADLSVRQHDFAANACELDPDEDCIGAAGLRTLLNFTVEIPNQGTADLILGSPHVSGNPNFTFSACHQHFHFAGFADYRLLDAGGNVVVTGRKQAFCLTDSRRYHDGDDSVSFQPSYGCDFQGLSRGWSDVYASDVPCQHLDITDVPDGDYTLAIDINTAGLLPESDTSNNSVVLPVTLGNADLDAPTEACPAELPTRAVRGRHRECGWTDGGLLSCTPGATARVACSDACEIGSCTGDPVLRVCDAAVANCSFPNKLAAGDDACGGVCPLSDDFVCPPGGQVRVFHAPAEPGQPYSCVPAVLEP